MSILAAFMVPHPPLIVPDIGRGEEEKIRETIDAYEEVARQIAELQPETIIISSPHAVMYSDYFHISPGNKARGSFDRFNAPQVTFEERYDEELVRSISDLAAEADLPAGTLGEKDPRLDHGTMVPLWFIRRYYKEGKIIRTGLSGLPLADHYRLGILIKKAVAERNRRAVFIASGDLSHKLQSYGPYGFAKEGPQYDERIMDTIGRGAFGELLEFDEDFCEKAAECGHRSFVIMAGAFDGLEVKTQVLSHQDITGVGYGIATIYPEKEDEDRRFLKAYEEKLRDKLNEKKANEDPYVALARKTIEEYVIRRKRPALPSDLPSEMLEREAGTFVSIHKDGMLRGCIGTIMPTRENIAEEIIANAISAATRDPRFDPIRENELPWLEISVDILGEIEDIASAAELDVKRYGVIVSSGRRRGLLLPDLDGVDSVEQQIDIARQKGGIGKDEAYQLQRFEVIRHY